MLSVSIATPINISLGKVCFILPVLGVDKGQNSCSISTGLTAKNTVAGTTVCCFIRMPGSNLPGQVVQKVLADIVFVSWFVQMGNPLNSFIQQSNQMRESVTEKAANTHQHINTRPSQFFKGNNCNSFDTAIFSLPNRAHPKQGKTLGNIISMSAHSTRAPNAQTDALGVTAFFGLITSNQLIGQLSADPPGCLAGDGLGIDRVKVASGGQNVGHTARWGAGWACRNIASL